MTETRKVVEARREQKKLDRVIVVSLLFAVLCALAFGAINFFKDQKQDEKLAAIYDQTRDDKIGLCKDKANADKPECATTPPPVEKVAPEIEVATMPAPVIITQRLPVIREVQTLPAEEVRKAVLAACGGSCKGKDVTADMVADGIIAYCKSGACTPKDGKDAPPPSDAQVQAAVATFCSQNDCKGDPGPTCPEGYTGGVLAVMTSLTESTEIFACQKES